MKTLCLQLVENLYFPFFNRKKDFFVEKYEGIPFLFENVYRWKGRFVFFLLERGEWVCCVRM